MPIRLRLALVCGGLVALVVIGLGALVYVRLESDLRAAVDDGLLSRAETLAAGSPDETALPVGPSDVGDIFAQLLSPDGRVVATTPGIATDGLLIASDVATLQASRYFEAEVQTVDEPVVARLLAQPTPDGRVIVVGVSFDDQREVLATLRGGLVLATPLAVGLAALVGWLVAGAALRPVERMRAESEAVSGLAPGRRLPVPGTGNELAALGRSLNRMLDRLDAAVERERRFVADASHELRTPLANLKAELDLALRRARTLAELTAALRSASEETDRLTRLAEDLLLLSSTEGRRVPLGREDVDLAPIIRETLEEFAGRASTLGVRLESSVEDGVRAQLDRVRIRQAIGNLVDNALRHTPRGGRVTIDSADGVGMLTISVADTGPGFPAEFLPRAFEAFSRGDPARTRATGGTGLGLAIVRSVAAAHGGTVEATNRQGAGALVVIRIPR